MRNILLGAVAAIAFAGVSIADETLTVTTVEVVSGGAAELIGGSASFGSSNWLPSGGFAQSENAVVTSGVALAGVDSNNNAYATHTNVIASEGNSSHFTFNGVAGAFEFRSGYVQSAAAATQTEVEEETCYFFCF